MSRHSLIIKGDVLNEGTTGLSGPPRIPAWNTAGRPKKIRPGTFGFNLETKRLEFWDGTTWNTLRMKKI